jgi:DNA polymerase-3 subunit alpha
MTPVENRPTLRLKPSQPASQLECLTWEKQLLGLYISAHPFSQFKNLVDGKVTTIANLVSCAGTDTVYLAGIITSIKKILTKSHETMFFAKLEDGTGAIEILVFPKILSEQSAPWVEDQAIVVCGRISDKDSERKIIANQAVILNLDDAETTLRSFIPSDHSAVNSSTNHGLGNLYLSVPAGTNRDTYDKLKHILLKYPGEQSVYIVLPSPRGQRVVKAELRVGYDSKLLTDVGQLLGPDAVKVN